MKNVLIFIWWLLMLGAEGIVIAYGWNNFVTPLGVPSVGAPQALALSILIGCASFQSDINMESGQEVKRMTQSSLVIFTAFILLWVLTFSSPKLAKG